MKLLFIVLLMPFLSWTQNASIKGQIVNDASLSVPMAKVWLKVKGSVVARYRASMDGEFKFGELDVGVYDVMSTAMGHDTNRIQAIIISDSVQQINLGEIQLSEGSYFICSWPIWPPPIQRNNDLNKAQKCIIIVAEDIRWNKNLRQPNGIIDAVSTDVFMKEDAADEIMVRGSRPEGAMYYIDGVKSNNMRGVSNASISSIKVYSSGIPAKYGDTTAGVIVLETKSYFDLYYAWKARQ